MPNSDPVIVLAAGRGTRMGGPKALMDIGREPWWRRQCRALSAITTQQIWVISPELRRAFDDPPAPIELVEADADAPMFASLHAGLRHLRSGPQEGLPPVGVVGVGVYVLPVDVPAAEPGVWAALRNADAPSIPTSNGRGGHPVHLPWVWITERILLTTPDPAARLDALLADAAIRVPVDDESVCRNLNRPEDLDAWLTPETRS